VTRIIEASLTPTELILLVLKKYEIRISLMQRLHGLLVGFLIDFLVITDDYQRRSLKNPTSFYSPPFAVLNRSMWFPFSLIGGKYPPQLIHNISDLNLVSVVNIFLLVSLIISCFHNQSFM
jgi:hypothetical protein